MIYHHKEMNKYCAVCRETFTALRWNNEVCLKCIREIRRKTDAVLQDTDTDE
jgi:hypothetical protein